MSLPTNISLTSSPDWKDYQLLDSGNGKTLERFGNYLLIRPRPQAIWSTTLPSSEWKKANAVLVEEKQEFGGKWNILNPMDKSWMMSYKDLKFQLQLKGGKLLHRDDVPALGLAFRAEHRQHAIGHAPTGRRELHSLGTVPASAGVPVP